MNRKRIEHWLPGTPREVWCALIRHSELAEDGALLRFPLPGGASADPGRITLYDSPHRLECAWGGGKLRWELEARGGMTRLVFTRTRGAGAALDWEACLASLAAA